jgi:hypothetical protein
MVDVFALYIYDRDEILYITSKELCDDAHTITIRLDPPKHNQIIGINYADKYRDFKRVLRDYEPNSLTLKEVGDDIAQTTTE